jgi:hypothetical protein
MVFIQTQWQDIVHLHFGLSASIVYGNVAWVEGVQIHQE